MITVEQIEALEIEQRLRHRIGAHTVISVVRRATGFAVEGTCSKDAATAIAHDFKVTDWAPAGTMYLWSLRTTLTAPDALEIALRAVATLESVTLRAADAGEQLVRTLRTEAEMLAELDAYRQRLATLVMTAPKVCLLAGNIVTGCGRVIGFPAPEPSTDSDFAPWSLFSRLPHEQQCAECTASPYAAGLRTST